jgi:hypothetical protein
MTICNIIFYENIKYKQLKLSISLNIYPSDSLTFISLSLISMSYKGEIDIGIRLHSRTFNLMPGYLMLNRLSSLYLLFDY